jgi:hypothetical protein
MKRSVRSSIKAAPPVKDGVLVCFFFVLFLSNKEKEQHLLFKNKNDNGINFGKKTLTSPSGEVFCLKIKKTLAKNGKWVYTVKERTEK